MAWHLYVVRTVDDTLYAGIATDVERRYEEHRARNTRSAKYLLAHEPRELAFDVEIGDRSLALKVEHAFKRLSRADKEAILAAEELCFDLETGAIELAREA